MSNNRGESNRWHRVFCRRPSFLVHAQVESGACRIRIRVLLQDVGDAACRTFIARGGMCRSLGVPRRRDAAVLLEIRRQHGRRGCWRLPGCSAVCELGEWSTGVALRKRVVVRRGTVRLSKRTAQGDTTVVVPRQLSEGPGRIPRWRLRRWLLPRSLVPRRCRLPPRLVRRPLHDGCRRLVAPGLVHLLPRGLGDGLVLCRGQRRSMKSHGLLN
mmetsp:Transcript_75506/g.216190  ORF Transcript_75506/g.216190 Transcript_75506/m.216190 type:complete len:214 (-) Transcript_75506:532-1173(-)